ncbi:hypothetical protein V8F20_001458 [Naviculisporaceae sp. PSN 640]
MSVCLYVCMSVCLYVCMSVCLYVCHHTSEQLWPINPPNTEDKESQHRRSISARTLTEISIRRPANCPPEIDGRYRQRSSSCTVPKTLAEQDGLPTWSTRAAR